MAVGLAEGRQVVGSGAGSTVTLRAGGVADRHAVLDVTSASVRLVSGARARSLDGDTVLAIGETLACVVPVPDATRSPVPGCGPAIVHNRRRRPAPPAPLPRVVLPDPPPAEPAPRPMGWAALAMPVIFGLVMAVLVDPRMALFALLGPLVMAGGRVDDLRLRRRARRTATADSGFRRRRPRRHPRPAPRPRAPSPSRRPTRCGGSRLVGGTPVASVWGAAWRRRRLPEATIGYGICRGPPISPAIRTTRRPVAAALAGLMRATPVTLTSAGGCSGSSVTGSPPSSWARAAVLGRRLRGPFDLAVAVVTDRPADWNWAKWLPHVMVAPTDRRRLLAGDPVETGAVLDWIATRPGAGQRRPVLVVVTRPADRPSWPGGASGAGARQGLRGRHRPGGREDDLPTECTTWSTAGTAAPGLHR